jgi:hypothetical protein
MQITDMPVTCLNAEFWGYGALAHRLKLNILWPRAAACVIVSLSAERGTAYNQ